jgi:hypothetical protein
MGFIASPASQQHMTAGFMLVTMEDVVSVSLVRFLLVDSGVSCLDLFQSMLMKIMFASTVLCSSGTVPEPAEHVEADHADRMALLVEAATA